MFSCHRLVKDFFMHLEVITVMSFNRFAFFFPAGLILFFFASKIFFEIIILKASF
jgi:hypothetical protein